MKQFLQNNIELVLCWQSKAGHESTLKCIYVPSETLLDKTNFSFANGCQM